MESIGSYPNQLEIPYHPDHSLIPSLTQEHLEQAHEIILSYLGLVAEVRSLGISASMYEYNEQLVRNSVCYLIMVYHLGPKMVYQGLEFLYGRDSNSNYFRYISTHGDRVIRQSYKLIFIKITSVLCSALSASNVEPCLYLVPAPEKTDLRYVQNILQQGVSMIAEVGKNYTKIGGVLRVHGCAGGYL